MKERVREGESVRFGTIRWRGKGEKKNFSLKGKVNEINFIQWNEKKKKKSNSK